MALTLFRGVVAPLLGVFVCLVALVVTGAFGLGFACAWANAAWRSGAMVSLARSAPEREALWSVPSPGDCLLLKFMRDPVWHEMLMTWPCEKESATLYTLDGDHYEFRVISDGRGGPRALQDVLRDGGVGRRTPGRLSVPGAWARRGFGSVDE